MSIPMKTLTLPIETDGTKTPVEYTFVQLDSTLAVSGKAADAKATGDRLDAVEAEAEQALETKANIDGSYESMTVGNAEQLISTVNIEDSVPYIFRTSGGSADIGDREYDEIVGGTIAWNQQIPALASDNWNTQNSSVSYSNNVATITKNNSGTFGIYAKTANLFGIEGHKYFITATVNASDGGGEFLFGFQALYKTKIVSEANKDTTIATIQSAPSSQSCVLYWYGSGSGTSFTAKNYMAIDLTQLFGSTIADYIYSLETATAGAGVAWFRKLFPKPYYAYDAGTLKSVEGLSSHVMRGFNAWDEEWELGTLNETSGDNSNSSTNIRSKNYIPVIAGATYYVKTPSGVSIRVFKYGADKGFTASNYVDVSNGTITLSDDVHFLRFRTFVAYGTTYKNDICINLSWSGYRNGEYEPYKQWTYPLDSDLTLRGIPKLDANNALYYDGDTYASDGTVTRKYVIVDLGTLNWNYSSGNAFFYTNITGRAANANVVSDRYVNVGNQPDSAMASIANMSIAPINNVNGQIKIKNVSYTDAATFKTAMSGVYLVYELATPTTETADPFQSPQIVDDFGTEEYVTTGIVPVGHNTKYPANLRDKVQHLPDPTGTDGDYIIRETGEHMALVAVEAELPTLPTAEGTYKLRCTVSGTTKTLTWASDT